MRGRLSHTIIEGFAVETIEGLIFTVKGLLHPPDRVIAYLRYLPDSQGDRARGGLNYRRVYHFDEQREALLHHPLYLHLDPVFGLEVQSVPRRLVRAVYDPRLRLATLHRQGDGDGVEKDALALAELLQAAASVPRESLGVSGSVLLGLQRPDSDVDLVVYGAAEGRAVYRALHELMTAPAGALRRLDPTELRALHAAHRADTPLSFADFARLQARKVNEGRFRGRAIFFRFVKRPEETGERYGDRRFRPAGVTTVRARVTDDRDAIFTPCRYTVTAATVLGCPPASDRATRELDLREIVSFRGRFSDQARQGEWIVARGSLELVVPGDGSPHHRLVVGGRAGDYLAAVARDADEP